jgi:hypothetical protein
MNAIVPPSADLLAARRAARAEKAAADQILLDAHRVVAERLSRASASAATALRARASAQVDRWEHDGLCHASYVRAWRALLGQPLHALCAGMLREDALGVALRQNSPFGFALSER